MGTVPDLMTGLTETGIIGNGSLFLEHRGFFRQTRERIMADHRSKYKTRQREMLLDYLKTVPGIHFTAGDVCGYFNYVGGESDNWVDDALQEASNKDMIVINLMEDLGDAVKEEEVIEGMQEEEHGHEHEDGEEDDHAEESSREEDHEHGDGGPEINEEICVAGVFDTYEENGYTYCTLREASLL